MAYPARQFSPHWHWGCGMMQISRLIIIQELREPLSILIKYNTTKTPKIDNMIKNPEAKRKKSRNVEIKFIMLSIFGVSVVLYFNHYSLIQKSNVFRVYEL